MTRIWLNHWFSTAYHIIKLIKKGEDNLFIIGSNERPDAVYKEVCDEFFTEPVLPPDEYAAYCLDFCIKHEIDVFLPRRGMLGVSKHMEEFAKAGIKVMADSYDKLKTLNSKTEAYRLFSENGIASVPDYFLVEDINDFRNAYIELSGRYDKVCFKKVSDEGGMSFRLIDDSYKGYHALFTPSRTRITYAEAEAALAERGTFPPLIMMPYLSGSEVSVDSLTTPSGKILLPRFKTPTRTEIVRFDPYILSVCEKFLDSYELECPCNIQFRFLGDTPYFLEVNTRMSGGVQLACEACGVNLPNIAVNKLLGIEKPWSCEQREHRISFVETPIPIAVPNS